MSGLTGSPALALASEGRGSEAGRGRRAGLHPRAWGVVVGVVAQVPFRAGGGAVGLGGRAASTGPTGLWLQSGPGVGSSLGGGGRGRPLRNRPGVGRGWTAARPRRPRPRPKSVLTSASRCLPCRFHSVPLQPADHAAAGGRHGLPTPARPRCGRAPGRPPSCLGRGAQAAALLAIRDALRQRVTVRRGWDGAGPASIPSGQARGARRPVPRRGRSPRLCLCVRPSIVRPS